MTITSDELSQFTRIIWESTLGLKVQVAPPQDGPKETSIVCRVQISGAWLGTVLLSCPEPLAKRAARIMFALDADDPPKPEEMRDALAEMTNITAGNVKSLAGGRCYLAMPQVAAASAGDGAAPQDAVVCRQWFECEGEPFVVTVLRDNAGQDQPRVASGSAGDDFPAGHA